MKSNSLVAIKKNTRGLYRGSIVYFDFKFNDDIEIIEEDFNYNGRVDRD